VNNIVKQAIDNKIAPMEVVGEISKHGDQYRALVAVTPSGPLILMSFNISQIDAKM